MKYFDLDGQRYDYESLPENCKALFGSAAFVQEKLQRLSNTHAVLTRARNAYIADLRLEVVEARSGVDFDALFSSDD